MRLLNDILSVIKVGEFTLTSGKKSNFYIDIKSLLLRNDTLYKIGASINEHICRTYNPNFISAIGGMELGSVPISSSVCLCSNYPLNQFIIRKTPRSHGTKSQVEGWDLIKDKKIILVDDVLTTGGSLQKMFNIVKDHCQVVECIVIVNREDIDVNELTNLPPITSLYTKSELMKKIKI
jgi:orotate phosphoribosyltransferase